MTYKITRLKVDVAWRILAPPSRLHPLQRQAGQCTACKAVTIGLRQGQGHNVAARHDPRAMLARAGSSETSILSAKEAMGTRADHLPRPRRDHSDNLWMSGRRPDPDRTSPMQPAATLELIVALDGSEVAACHAPGTLWRCGDARADARQGLALAAMVDSGRYRSIRQLAERVRRLATVRRGAVLTDAANAKYKIP
jgi:hypothetical protein